MLSGMDIIMKEKTGARSDNKGSRLRKDLWKLLNNRGYIIIILLFCVFGSLYLFAPMYLPSAIEGEVLIKIFVIAGVAAIILFVFAYLIIDLTYREMRLNIDKEVIARVDEKLQCQSCMTEMLKIQTRLYNVELETFVQTLSVENIKKINLLVTSLASNDSTISEDEVKKFNLL